MTFTFWYIVYFCEFCYSQSKGDEDDDDIYQTFVETMAPIQSEIAKAQTVRFYQIRIDKVDATVGPPKKVCLTNFCQKC